MSWTQDEVENAFVELKKKATTDEDFRKLILTDPKSAIKQVTGKDVPEGFKIKVIESDPAYHMTFVLPRMLSTDLSDEELDRVAGGLCGRDTCVTAVDICHTQVGA
jgi:hypothetical protein